jgi:hypothetical protein
MKNGSTHGGALNSTNGKLMNKLVLLLSLALAGCSKTREIPASNLVVLGVGTSVTWGEKNTPGNKQLHSRVSGWSWARVGNETDSPARYSDSYSSDKKRCADEVHPTDEGAEDLGVGTIAHGIASFGKVHLK